MEQVSPARETAFNILLEIERRRRLSDDLTRGKGILAISHAPEDRNLTYALITALVFGVLRWQIVLDAHIRPLLKRPNAKLDDEVLITLRLGAFQLAYMDRIPAHAVIDESVELVKKSGHRFASGMVNAVLRKLARDPAPASIAPEIEAHPQWMVDRWTSLFGPKTASAICRHDQSRPALAARIHDPQTETELALAGIVLAPGALLRAARRIVSGDNLGVTPAFREGRVRIQDEGSQLVAEIAGKGTEILDCCAAPGGKTIILAERNPQARIIACEVSPKRLEAMRRRLVAFGDRVACRLADAATLEDSAQHDLVLADVPCSGTGTLARNPEIRHRLQPEDLARQSDRQRDILAAALRAACPGGRIVYSTCSLEPEENEHVIAAVLRDHPEARVVSLAVRLEEMRAEGILTNEAATNLPTCLTPEGYLRLFPGTFGTDGFFVALIEKTGTC